MATWSISKNFGSNNAYTVRLDLIGAEQSVENNQTYLHFACYLISNRPSASFTGQARTDTLTVAGMTVNPSHGYYELHGGGSVLLWKYDMTVDHDSDGTFLDKSVSCGVLIDTTFSSSGYIGTVTADGTMTLATIPRASTIGATDANIGAVSMIAVTRKSASFTHSIQFGFGDLTGYVTESGGVSSTEVKFSATSIPWTIPTSFYTQIPSAKAGRGGLTIRTYSGTTQIGSGQSCTFVATAAEANCKPTVSGTVVDSNDVTKALTGDERKLVQYYSTALCTITATAKNSATISGKSIAGSAVSGNTRSIPNVWFDSVSFIATDSRGYSSSATVKATMIPYVKLTNNATGTRTDPTSGNATLTMKGNYYNGSFGAVNNTLKIKYRIAGGKYVSVTPTISGNTYSASIPLTGLDYTQAYNYEVVVSDKLTTVSKPVTVGKGVPVFDWGESDMNINVPLAVPFITVDERMLAGYGIELGHNMSDALGGYGGYIDFHYNGSDSDYTSRIIETAAGKIRVDGDLSVTGAVSVGNIYNLMNQLMSRQNDDKALTDFNSGYGWMPGIWPVWNASGKAANGPYDGTVGGVCLVIGLYQPDGTPQLIYQLYFDLNGDVWSKRIWWGNEYGTWRKLTP